MKTLILTSLFLILTVSANAQSVKHILKDISVLTGKEDVSRYYKTSVAIKKYTTMYGIDYRVLLGLIMTESSFNQGAVSPTQDFGIGQINYKVWQKEFIRLNKEPLDLKRLKTDVDYAVRRTVEILALLKKNKDPYWVGRYHSKTPRLKKAYFAKIQHQVLKLEYSSKNIVTIASNK